jgi:hypothetical protein
MPRTGSGPRWPRDDARAPTDQLKGEKCSTPAGEVTFSAELDARHARMILVARISITLIAIVVFFMTVKP